MQVPHLAGEWISQRVARGEYIITRHAEIERRSDGLSVAEVETALRTGVILEEYPEDPRGPSCLVLGRVGSRSIHAVCGCNTDGWLVIITVYIPSMPKWRTPEERNRS